MMHRSLSVALSEEVQREIAGIKSVKAARNLVGALGDASSTVWIRLGVVVAGGAVVYVAARRLGFMGQTRDRRGAGSPCWCASEEIALQEVRLGKPTARASTVTSASVLVSDSEAAAHRGYRAKDVDDVIKELITKEAIGLDAHPAALVYDMDALKETLLAMKKAFPEHFMHAIAIKSNPLPFFLKFAVEQGFGLECASIAEVVLALRQGCSPDKIMFDSPAKSKREISFALRHNVQVNADNFFELDRIVQAQAQLQTEGVYSTSHIGVRINPLVGLGAIKALSVSDVRSKFGIPLNAENREKILDNFRKHSWLDAMHIHVGSQGCSMEQHASGAAKLADFVSEIEAAVGVGRIKVIDIGGGLPVNFGSEEVKPQYGDYSKILRHSAPSLFTNANRTVVTEYGRSVSAKAGWAVCAVEYVKKSGDGLDIAVIQAGADLFMRTCYCPQNFPLRVSGHNKIDGKKLVSAGPGPSGNGHANGTAEHDKVGTLRAQVRVTVAGPLCFGGDKVAEEVLLPELHEGDFVVLHDAGANTLSTFSRHCSRTAPPVYGYYRAGGDAQGGVRVVLLKPAETVEHVLSFWESY